jgi:sec-independent protein translocase protein TatB
MLNIGPGEVLAILVITLIVLGPEKLPEVLRTVGRVTSELRRISSGFQTELRNALDDEANDDVRTIKRTPRTPTQRRNGAGDAATPDVSQTATHTQHPDAPGDPLPDDTGTDEPG